MQRTAQESNANFEMSLRDQLIAAQSSTQPASEPPTTIHPPPLPHAAPPPYPDSGASSTHEHMDHSMSAEDQQQLEINMASGMDLNEALAAIANSNRAGRRELSSSKRAAQNRAAQRAFRQRKEAYITTLEKQVRDYKVMEGDFKTLQQENYQLREYILSLQGRLLETSSDLPPPPPQVSLQEPVATNSDHYRAHPHAQASAQAPQHHSQTQIDEQVKDEMRRSQASSQSVAPVASMAAQAPDENGPMNPAAVEQLKAAAAEAGELGTASAPKSGP